MDKEKTQKKLDIIKKSIENKKGADMRVLDIRELTTMTDYFVIVSGNSVPQVHAISDNIVEEMEKAGFEPYHTEGLNEGRWVILDFEEIIVHVFHREARDFYGLERLWTQEMATMESEENQ